MLPVQRKTRTQTRKGRSHLALRGTQTVDCPNCGAAKRPHCACRECGYVRPGLKLSLGKDED
jgi:large subunit ribosomal protein L32